MKTDRSVNKCMVTVFWDRKGAILTRYMPRGITINGNTYCQVLQHLHTAKSHKWPRWRHKFILLLRDNGYAHLAIKMQNQLRQFVWTVFKHPHV